MENHPSFSCRSAGNTPTRPATATALPPDHHPAPLRFLRIGEVTRRTGLARATAYELMKAGRFPAAIRLGGNKSRSVAWLEHEVEQWIRDQVAASRQEVG